MRIASAAMADAIRSVTIEQGQDPRKATLIAFGGAGPLFSTLIARELEIVQIIIPNYAGNFSAWGLLGQDVARSAARTSISRLDSEGLERTNELLLSLFEELATRSGVIAGDGVDLGNAEAFVDLRYIGQEYTLTVQPATDPTGRVTQSPDEIRSLFEVDYERTFGHLLSEPVEVVSARAQLRKPLPRTVRELRPVSPASAVAATEVGAFSFTTGSRVPFTVIDRQTLAPGQSRCGPLIILEETSTSYIDAGFEVSVLPAGALMVTHR
jgi:N-methylhydantoinase A